MIVNQLTITPVTPITPFPLQINLESYFVSFFELGSVYLILGLVWKSGQVLAHSDAKIEEILKGSEIFMHDYFDCSVSSITHYM